MNWAELSYELGRVVLVRDFFGPSGLVRVVFGPSCPAPVCLTAPRLDFLVSVDYVDIGFVCSFFGVIRCCWCSDHLER